MSVKYKKVKKASGGLKDRLRGKKLYSQTELFAVSKLFASKAEK
jgi:hypothetical protein